LRANYSNRTSFLPVAILYTERLIIMGYIWVALAATLWGTTGTAQALAPNGFTPLTIGAFRILLGAVVLITVAMYRGKLQRGQSWHIPTVLIAGLSIALYQPFFFEGTARTGVAVGTMVGIGSSPVFAGIIDWFWNKQRPSRIWFIATMLAVMGSLVLLSSGDDIMIRWDGVLFAFGAGLSYVIYTVTVRELTQIHEPEAVVAVTFALGALLLLPLLITGDLSPVFSINGLLIVLHLGIIATGLSYILFGYGVRIVPVSMTATLTLMEPLTAATLGILVLGEPFGLLQALGMGLIIGGLMVLALGSTGRKST